MTVISKALDVFKGRTAKLAGAVGAVLLLAPIPALGFTFLTQWSFSNMSLNAPTPAASSSDFPTGTELIVDMGRVGPTTQSGIPGSAVHPGAISFFTAQRNINVGAGGENVDIARTYSTLLQGASLQSIVYFQQLTGTNAGTRINVVPNVFNTSGPRFLTRYPLPTQNTGPVDVNLGPGDYTVFVRIKYKKDRFGIWDNSQGLPGSPHTFTISSAVGP